MNTQQAKTAIDQILKGKLAIESKSDMKKRGVHSPDRADAVFGAMTPVRPASLGARQGRPTCARLRQQRRRSLGWV
jgi:hypothetical protein